jgi:hypothetical protein
VSPKTVRDGLTKKPPGDERSGCGVLGGCPVSYPEVWWACPDVSCIKLVLSFTGRTSVPKWNPDREGAISIP